MRTCSAVVDSLSCLLVASAAAASRFTASNCK
jgi:hypothetical protein